MDKFTRLNSEEISDWLLTRSVRSHKIDERKRRKCADRQHVSQYLAVRSFWPRLPRYIYMYNLHIPCSRGEDGARSTFSSSTGFHVDPEISPTSRILSLPFLPRNDASSKNFETLLAERRWKLCILDGDFFLLILFFLSHWSLLFWKIL